MAEEQLADAQVRGLSVGTRFSLAYNAARLYATALIRSCGYRVSEEGGGHYNTFLALTAVDSAFRVESELFDDARKKRNTISYDRADVVSGTEAEQLLMEVTGFGQAVRIWLSRTGRTR